MLLCHAFLLSLHLPLSHVNMGSAHSYILKLYSTPQTSFDELCAGHWVECWRHIEVRHRLIRDLFL